MIEGDALDDNEVLFCEECRMVSDAPDDDDDDVIIVVFAPVEYNYNTTIVRKGRVCKKGT